MNNNIEVQPKNNDFIKEEDLWSVIYSYFKDLSEDKENKYHTEERPMQKLNKVL